MAQRKPGERIATARRERGLSQAALAELADIPGGQTVVSKYETDAREPGLDVIVRIARALGVTTDLLLGLEE